MREQLIKSELYKKFLKGDIILAEVDQKDYIKITEEHYKHYRNRGGIYNLKDFIKMVEEMEAEKLHDRRPLTLEDIDISNVVVKSSKITLKKISRNSYFKRLRSLAKRLNVEVKIEYIAPAEPVLFFIKADTYKITLKGQEKAIENLEWDLSPDTQM